MIRAEIGRIAGNFTRLLLGFLLGVVVVRGVLGFGTDIFNIYVLVTVGAGVAVMLRELIRRVIVPMLGEPWGIDDAAFARVYANSWAVSVMAAVFGAAVLGAMAWWIDRFSIDPAHVTAARWFIAGRIVMLVIGVVTLPVLSMLLVQERFQRSNTILVLERVADVLGVVVPLLVLGADARGDRALLWMTAASAGSFALIYLAYAWTTLRGDARLRPDWSLVDRAMLRRIGRGLAWSAVIVLSFNAYFRFDALFINLHLGAVETTAFGIAVQLAGMMRQLTTGLVSGLDAVVVRVLRGGAGTARQAPAQAPAPGGGHRQGTADATVARLTQISLRLQAVLTAGSIALLAVAIDPILSLWLGSALSDPAVADATRAIILLVAAGLGARSLTEGFMQALNARGAMRAYAVWLLPIAILNPVVLLTLARLAPDRVDLPLVGWLFLAGMAVFGLVVVPAKMMRLYGTRPRDMAASAVPPFVAAGIGALAYLQAAPMLTWGGSLAKLALASACIGLPLLLESGYALRRMARTHAS